MTRRPPLQISIFFLLAIFTLAGKGIEGTSYLLRQDITAKPVFQEATSEQDTPTIALNNQAKDTRIISGEVIARKGNSVAIKENNTITNVTLPSNASVIKNGLDAKRSAVADHDYIIASTNARHTIASLTSLSKPVVDVLRVLLVLSVATAGYLLCVFAFRFVSKPYATPLRRDLAS